MSALPVILIEDTMDHLKAYSAIFETFFFWLNLYYRFFMNPLPEKFRVLREIAEKKKDEVWISFFDIVIFSEEKEYQRCYHRTKRFLEEYQSSPRLEIQAALPIVRAYYCHALYECKYYKEAIDGIEALWVSYKHYAKKRQGYALFLLLTGQWKKYQLLPIHHQTLVWITYLRACLLGRHRYFAMALQNYEDLENTFSRFGGVQYQYWIARSWMDRGLIHRDLKDTENELAMYDRVIKQHKKKKSIMLQCVVAMTAIFKANSLFDHAQSQEGTAMLDWVMARTEPPKPDYLQEIFISASASKSTFYLDHGEWQANYNLRERDIKRFSQNPHIYAKRLVAGSEHDQALELMRMGKTSEAVALAHIVVDKYKDSGDPFIHFCSISANAMLQQLTKQQKEKKKTTHKSIKSPLEQWSLFSQFANPNLN